MMVRLQKSFSFGLKIVKLKYEINKSRRISGGLKLKKTADHLRFLWRYQQA